MKITTYIDGALLKQAFRISRFRTQREVLESGLRSLVAEVQRHTFVRDFDHLRLRLSPDELAETRR